MFFSVLQVPEYSTFRYDRNKSYSLENGLVKILVLESESNIESESENGKK
jgi:hypothetical protein